VHTPNEKLFFLFGIDNDSNSFSDENLEMIQSLLENFTPNFFIYEKDLK
jgi:hypothetical protein